MVEIKGLFGKRKLSVSVAPCAKNCKIAIEVTTKTGFTYLQSSIWVDKESLFDFIAELCVMVSKMDR